MKKFYFEYCEYAQMDVLDGVVVFEESEEQAITYFKEILASEDFQQKVSRVEFEDFGEPEEMSIKNPSKAFKGYYIEESTCGWDC